MLGAGAWPTKAAFGGTHEVLARVYRELVLAPLVFVYYSMSLPRGWRGFWIERFE